MKEINEKSVLNNEPNENVVMQHELSDDELNQAAGGSYMPDRVIRHRQVYSDDDELLPTLPRM